VIVALLDGLDGRADGAVAVAKKGQKEPQSGALRAAVWCLSVGSSIARFLSLAVGENAEARSELKVAFSTLPVPQNRSLSSDLAGKRVSTWVSWCFEGFVAPFHLGVVLGQRTKEKEAGCL